jgi:hypothetical protein
VRRRRGSLHAMLRQPFFILSPPPRAPPNVISRCRLPSGQDGTADYDRHAASIFDALWRLGDAPSGFSVVAARRRWTGEADLDADQISASKPGFLVKTFQERRTWLALFRAYYRVIAFHVCPLASCMQWYFALASLLAASMSLSHACMSCMIDSCRALTLHTSLCLVLRS